MRAMLFVAFGLCAVCMCGLAWSQPTATVELEKAAPSLDKLPTLPPEPGADMEPLPLSAQARTIYVATRDALPGVVLRIAGGAEHLVYRRNTRQNLTSFDFGPWLRPADPGRTVLYFCNGVSSPLICYAFAPGHEAVLGAHRTIVREVDYVGGALYFSEASGAGGNGRIFRLAPGSPPALYYTVVLGQVGGFWGGHFAFGPDGKLYISNGNTTGAGIWHCPRPGVPRRVYRTRGPIHGFHFTDRKTFLYTDGTERLRRATIGAAAAAVVFTSPQKHKYCDVVVR